MHLSNRASITPASPIRRLAGLAQAAKARGTKVYHLNIGQPDIRSPHQFFAGLKKYHEDVLAYEQSMGHQPLINSWSKFMNRELALNTKPENFLITMGASEALIFSFMVCCDPGDEIIVFDPTYANYLGFAAVSGVKLVPVPTYIENNFCLPAIDEISKKITPKTKAILICNPNNPTGTVYPREQLMQLNWLCESKDLFLLADETYREFIYGEAKPVSLLHVAPESKKIVVIDSLSKRFSLCGARIGCLITSNIEFLEAVHKIAQARLAAPTIEQYAAAYMLDNISGEFIAQTKEEYKKRRDALFAGLSKISGVVVHKPEGAFYAVAAFPVEDAEDFAKFMLNDFSYNGETTFVAPAAGFYIEAGRGMNKLRIAYVLEVKELEKALDVLGRGLEAYQDKVKSN